uniref:Uncharacterized protein n=1 Tax=viral metagenome TaxID=1070528 RepID=A0A6C0EKP9_9ZZZZ
MSKQRGGRAVMSSEYYNRNSGRYSNTANNRSTESPKQNNVGHDLNIHPNNSGIKTGGAMLPSEYFAKNSNRYGLGNNVNNSAYGKVYATSHGKLIKPNLMGPDLGAFPNNTLLRTGGGKCNCNCNCKKCENGNCKCPKGHCNCSELKGGAYHKIINPTTGRKVNVSSNLGKKILNNYLRMLY